MKQFRIMVTVPDYMYNEIDTIAKSEFRSMSNVVYKILMEHFTLGRKVAVIDKKIDSSLIKEVIKQ